MHVLYITTARRTGAWLADALASDNACQITIEEARGAADALRQLGERAFDAVLASHEPGEIDAVELVAGLRAGGMDEPLVILGQASEQEMAALSYEAGADAYVCVNTVTTRTLLWILARASERCQLIRENRRSAQAERQRQHRDHDEMRRLLTEQRGLTASACDSEGEDDLDRSPRAMPSRLAGDDAKRLDDRLKCHYRELLRAHVVMSSGNLASEMSQLAESLAAADVSAQQIVRLHTEVLEEMVRGLGSRSARHVMTRADLLVLDVLVHLSECYRARCAAT